MKISVAKTQTSVRLEPDIHAFLMEQCKKTGKTKEEIIKFGLIKLMLDDSAAAPSTRLFRFLAGEVPPWATRAAEATVSYLAADLPPLENGWREGVRKVLEAWMADPRHREQLIRMAGEKHIEGIDQVCPEVKL